MTYLLSRKIWVLFVVCATVLMTTTFALVPVITHAAILDTLVPCGNDISHGTDANYIWYWGECDICDLTRLAMNVLNFLIVISIAFAALLFANAGFLYITSPGNSGNIARAHKIFTSALIGIVLILAAYLLIDTVMRILISGDLGVEANIQGYGPWNEILCVSAPERTIDGRPAYKIKSLSSIDLNASELVLPKVSCVGIGGTGCAATCTVGQRSVTGTECVGATAYCCIPGGSPNAALNSSCTLTTSGYIGSPGTCTTMDVCDDGGRHMESVASCGAGLVCCHGTAPEGNASGTYDTTFVSSVDARAQLVAAGVNISPTMTNGSTPVQQGVIDEVIRINAACGGCVQVNSLTGGHAGGGHVRGVKVDIQNTVAAYNYFTSAAWTKTGDRGGSYAGPNYRDASNNINCVCEKCSPPTGHWDCCMNDSDRMCT